LNIINYTFSLRVERSETKQSQGLRLLSLFERRYANASLVVTVNIFVDLLMSISIFFSMTLVI
ncbi:MAG: hypothetical protein AAFR83_23480, partial [Cyanobacteria bacterium J06629_18]